MKDEYPHFTVGSKVKYPLAEGPGNIGWGRGVVTRIEEGHNQRLYEVNDLLFPEEGLKPDDTPSNGGTGNE